MRAQGPPQETVLYGLENAGEWEGAFEIGASFGEIAVGPSGPDLLVIVRSLLTRGDFHCFSAERCPFVRHFHSVRLLPVDRTPRK